MAIAILRAVDLRPSPILRATDEVYLWLGANVMLAYPIPEAEELLQSKLSTAKQSLSTCEEDLDFLREQITVCILHAVG